MIEDQSVVEKEEVNLEINKSDVVVKDKKESNSKENQSIKTKESLKEKSNDQDADKKEESKSTTEEKFQPDDLIKEYLPDFADIIQGVSLNDANKMQSWMKEKLEKGFEEIKETEKKEKNLQKELEIKLKEKYGDNFEDVRKNALSLLPENFKIDVSKELSVIEKLYETYKKLEVKPPINAKNVDTNMWCSGSPFLNSSHPDHKSVFNEYLKGLNGL